MENKLPVKNLIYLKEFIQDIKKLGLVLDIPFWTILDIKKQIYPDVKQISKKFYFPEYNVFSDILFGEQCYIQYYIKFQYQYHVNLTFKKSIDKLLLNLSSHKDIKLYFDQFVTEILLKTVTNFPKLTGSYQENIKKVVRYRDKINTDQQFQVAEINVACQPIGYEFTTFEALNVQLQGYGHFSCKSLDEFVLFRKFEFLQLIQKYCS